MKTKLKVTKAANGKLHCPDCYQPRYRCLCNSKRGEVQPSTLKARSA